jgi:hypothetical protein
MLSAPPQPEKVLSAPTLEGVAEAIRESKCTRCVVVLDVVVTHRDRVDEFCSP